LAEKIAPTKYNRQIMAKLQKLQQITPTKTAPPH